MNIHVREVDPTPAPTNIVFSSNRGYWFSADSPHTTQAPWTNRITVFNERDHNVEIALISQSGYGVKNVEWINEKLLFIEMWWGRMHATDMIYDVEKEQMIYKEMKHNGWIAFQQYQQVKQTKYIILATLFGASHIAPAGVSEIKINIGDLEEIYIKQSSGSWKI